MTHKTFSKGQNDTQKPCATSNTTDPHVTALSLLQGSPELQAAYLSSITQ